MPTKKLQVNCKTGEQVFVELDEIEIADREKMEVEFAATTQRDTNKKLQSDLLRRSVVGFDVQKLTDKDRDLVILYLLDKMGLVDDKGVIV